MRVVQRGATRRVALADGCTLGSATLEAGCQVDGLIH
jgi:hypothetical protein